MQDRFPSQPPAAHPRLPMGGKIGVLLVNLGTPDAPDTASVRRYLKEFLSDRRVVEANPLLWKLVLHGIILNVRPARTARNYAKVWRNDGSGSPLRHFTLKQAEGVSAALSGESRLVVDWAMRYGNPSLESRITALQEKGCDRILIFPLYPQYSASTNGSVADQTFRVLMKKRWQPTLRIVPGWHDHPAYIEAVAQGIEQHLSTLDWQPEVILASFHGIPKEYWDKGDPYPCFCAVTARLLRQRLQLDESRLLMTFQSRFGPKEWTQPYTDATLEKLAKDGIRKVAVFSPGFVSDCIETLEEIALGSAEVFNHAGGTHFTAIPCINDSPAAISAFTEIVRRELAGWI